MELTPEELIKQELKELFEFKDISHVNYKPHPFMLGPKHIEFSADKYSGILGDPCINDKNFPLCSNPGCTLSYKEHTSDRVLFLSLTRDMTREEAQEVLMGIKPILEKENIDGVAFIETDQKFRIKDE